MLEIVRKAIEKAGSTKALEEYLDCRRQAFHSWDEVPRGRCIELEELTGVPREEINPNLKWPPRETPEAAA